ncbi:hypothetical protein QBC47DRAFT_406155 [Echria macrotheca]|uniref:Uncharacterized protein n=1 Tax=Echria macrotheca TaxID=438768 RepID=A0AAJ0F5K3_9PEZI|nr:hypothetical protein QBC47DRAFT_406155 [Echria macrotheca]
MCSWEQTIYDECGHKGKIRRVEYSCRIYVRYRFGECAFDPRYDCVFQVISYRQYCPKCRDLYQYVNL